MAKRARASRSRGQAIAKAPAQTTGSSRNLLLAVVSAVVVVAVGLVLLITQSLNKPVAATDRVGEGTAWGAEDAAVTIVDYSDFGCSHCASFAQNQGPQLRAEYEATGKVRFEFKHFIIGGQQTADAANAAECAADQGKFWDYHDVLFARQATSSAPFSKASLKQYAAQLGLDTVQFNACVDEGQHLEKVYRDTAEGRGQSVNATPTFFINGQIVQGAQPYAVFKAMIDTALVAAK